jgi:hypothetical protein
MTTEEKFKKLLDIACKNGFDKEVQELLENEEFKVVNNFIFIGGYDYQRNSLNDLVLETNFFDCLFSDSKNKGCSKLSYYFESTENGFITEESYHQNCSLIEWYKFQWVLEVEKGTALEWLFNQFDI